MTTSHGTRLRIDAWLPIDGDTAGHYARAKEIVEEMIVAMHERGFQILSAKDRVTSRREKP